jgi:hypothetical protein
MSLYLVARCGRCTRANGRDGVEVATTWRARRQACEGVEGATAGGRGRGCVRRRGDGEERRHGDGGRAWRGAAAR